MKDIVSVDFETEKIESRPDYPPKPVGVAIKEYGRAAKYFAWGHPTENNCTKEDAKGALQQVWKSKKRKVFHNAGFDMEVANAFFSLRYLSADEFEDTMFLAFLFNPRMRSVGLKEASVELLGMAPDEQTELVNWIVKNIRKPNGKEIPPSQAGRYIAFAPGKLVGRYAKGDVIRTEALYDFAMPEIIHWGMLDAYATEKQVLPISLSMEQHGIRLDESKLVKDLKKYERMYKTLEKKLLVILGDINLNAGQQIADAMERIGVVSDAGWQYTKPTKNFPDGQRKTGRNALEETCSDPRLADLLGLHSKLSKILTTYIRPWTESALNNNGLFYPWFNQVRSDDGYGTKTGRFSSNFQQVPKKPGDKRLPYMRNYIIPDEPRHIIIARDFASQEYRILAHFECDKLLEAYLTDPWLDPHSKVRDLIYELLHVMYERTPVKIINFGKVYGSGIASTSKSLKVSEAETRTLINAYDKAMPGVKKLMKEISRHTKQGEPIKTVGGRIYYAERGWEYRMLNTLIQSSAADHTKRSMVRIDEAFKVLDNGTRIMITVHDEFLNSTPRVGYKNTMKVFREAMDADDLMDLPMLSDGKYGDCWGTCVKFKESKI